MKTYSYKDTHTTTSQNLRAKFTSQKRGIFSMKQRMEIHFIGFITVNFVLQDMVAQFHKAEDIEQ